MKAVMCESFRNRLLIMICASLMSLLANAGNPPVLLFSDLVSGPDTGLGDGKGDGVIVTLWGQHLGAEAGGPIEFVDSLGVSRHVAHTYYWKNADGQLPGGPADLFDSHRMQEIAISIPDSALGLGSIKLSTSSGVSELPFTVRVGEIYHITPDGDDAAGQGTYASPWGTVARGDGVAGAGDTLYIHGVKTTVTQGSGRVYYNNKGFKATKANQFAYVSYPNTRVELYGKDGVHMYLTTGIVTSKLSVFVSNCTDESLAGCVESGTNGIAPSDWGRVIGNKVTDRPGMCSSGQSGAISGGINRVEGSKIFGNYIHDYGCPNSGKLHHTTYLTIRDNANDKSIEAWEFGWNYLKDNHAKNGIHNYDEDNSHNDSCGDLTTDLLIHDNVIVNQGGNGITIESACGWSQDTYIYNNVLINVGLPVDVDCTFNCGSPSTGINVLDNGLLGDVFIQNNSIHTWDEKNQESSLQACIALRGSKDNARVYIKDNVCYTEEDKYFVRTFSFSSVNHEDNVSGSGNSFYTKATNPVKAVQPVWNVSALFDNPLLLVSGDRISLGQASPLINKSINTFSHDIYGVKRGGVSEVGAVVAVPEKAPPNPPSAISGEVGLPAS